MIVEINHDAITTNLDLEFRKIAKFYAHFEKHSIVFLVTNCADITDIIVFDNNEVIIKKQELSEVAKNRIVNNMIDQFPELVIPVLDYAIKAYLIKIRKRNAQRRE